MTVTGAVTGGPHGRWADRLCRRAATNTATARSTLNAPAA